MEVNEHSEPASNTVMPGAAVFHQPAKKGLRRRVAFTIALFSLMLVLAQTAVVVILTEEQEDDVVSQILDDQIRQLHKQFRQGVEPTLPSSEKLQGYLVRNADDALTLPPYLRELPLGTTEIKQGERTLNVAVRREGDTKLYLVYDATVHEDRVDDFRTLMLFGAATMAVVIAGLGYWLAGLLVSQVSDLARRVAELPPGQESAPLAGEYQDEEVARLAAAFDQYSRKVADLLRREKDFTANASHELRTPLTSISTGCELLLQEPQLRERSRDRLKAMAQAAERMSESINALLLLARETAAGEFETVNVREAVQECLDPLREAIPRNRVALEIAVAPESTLQTNRSALRLILSNLLKNAIDHTDRGAVTVRYAHGILSITDTGCGIAKADLPHIFERYYRGRPPQPRHQGSGLGLAIVKQVAERLGWRVSVQSTPGGGSTFQVQFPPASQMLHV